MSSLYRCLWFMRIQMIDCIHIVFLSTFRLLYKLTELLMEFLHINIYWSKLKKLSLNWYDNISPVLCPLLFCIRSLKAVWALGYIAVQYILCRLNTFSIENNARRML